MFFLFSWLAQLGSGWCWWLIKTKTKTEVHQKFVLNIVFLFPWSQEYAGPIGNILPLLCIIQGEQENIIFQGIRREAYKTFIVYCHFLPLLYSGISGPKTLNHYKLASKSFVQYAILNVSPNE